MDNLIKEFNFRIADEIYRILVINDGNRLCKYKIYKNGENVKSIYQELRRLNVLFDMQIDYIPVGRTKLNTREFATKVVTFLEKINTRNH